MTPDEIRQRIDALHRTIKRDLDRDAIMLITPLVLESHAMILDMTSRLAEQQTSQLIESSKIMERQTSQLISLTRALVWLTVSLLVFTVVLAIRG